MKKKWYSTFDYMKLPIIMLMVSSVLSSFGSLSATNEILRTAITAVAFLGDMIREMLPLTVIVCYLGRKYEDFSTVIVGIICYICLNVVMMFFADRTLPEYFYTNILSFTGSNGVQVRPLSIGLFASIVVCVSVSFAYTISRKRYNYGILLFISNDAWFFINALLLTIGFGALITWQYPRAARYLYRVMRFISKNSSNPAMMFIYNMMEKVMNLFGMHGIVESSFWYGEFGGSWTDASKINHMGDVNIWTSQLLSNSIAKGTGRYITNYYVCNLFIIPSIIIGYYLNISNKMERRRQIGLVILGIALSLVTGNILPIEYAMLFMAPAALLTHLVLSSISAMLLSMLNVQIGYSNAGNLLNGSVGNLFDFIGYFKNPDIFDAASNVLIIGLIFFVIYQVYIWLYYGYLSHDFLDSQDGHNEMKNFVIALGGLNNIEMITSTPLSVVAVLKDNDRLNAQELLNTRAYKIRERYFGYYIDYGPGSAALCRQIRKEIKNYKDCLLYHERA